MLTGTGHDFRGACLGHVSSLNLLCLMGRMCLQYFLVPHLGREWGRSLSRDRLGVLGMPLDMLRESASFVRLGPLGLGQGIGLESGHGNAYFVLKIRGLPDSSMIVHT